MALTQYRRALLLSAAIVGLFLPACATPPVSPFGLDLTPEAAAHNSPSSPAPPPGPIAALPVTQPQTPRALPLSSPGPVEEKNGLVWETLSQEVRSADRPADFWDRLDRDIDLAQDDYRHYYSGSGLALLALGIGLDAPLANTSADRSIRRWYQRGIKGQPADLLADIAGYGGQLWVIAPVGVEAAALAGRPLGEGWDVGEGVQEWSNRSLRAIAVGFPPVLAMYVALGSSRPDRGDSRWHPFQDIHGASGHTFVGAVPFLTAASMTDNPWYQGPLVLGSFLSGWSRLHQDKHYFSQIALGWWSAYLAVHAVNQTATERGPLSLVPSIGPDGAGVALQLQY